MSIAQTGQAVWNLPPLILHPFNEHVPPTALLENSKAALMLSGLIPGDGTDEEVLHRKVMAGRYAEVRMLFFLGKDVSRWLEQCMEIVDRHAELYDRGVMRQSFAGLLTAGPPEAVREKLLRWGVLDYPSIFARAIGIHALFAEPPDAGTLSEEFLRNYHRYSDALFRCFMEAEKHATIIAEQFPFELYASGEYSRMLESEWGGDEP